MSGPNLGSKRGIQWVSDKDLSLEDAQRFLEAGYSRRSAVYGTASEKMLDLKEKTITSSIRS